MGHCLVKKSGLLNREARLRTQEAGVQGLDTWVSAAWDEGRVRDALSSDGDEERKVPPPPLQESPPHQGRGH